MTATQDSPEVVTLTDKLISTSEVSRHLNLPVARIKKAVLLGALTPTQICLDGRLHLWRISDLGTIRTRIETLDRVQPTSTELAN